AGPQVIATEQSGPVTPSAPPALLPAVTPVAPRRRDRIITLGFTGVAVFLLGWLTLAPLHLVPGPFARRPPPRGPPPPPATAGVAGAGVIIGREPGSLFKLKSVEAIHQKFAGGDVAPGEARAAIADALAVVPRERETVAAIEAFQRQVQRHHTGAQQVELLS